MKHTQQVLIKVPKENEDEKLRKSRGFELKTKNGYRLDEVVSALQKAIRRGQEEKALFFAYEMVNAGFVAYFWRRMSVISLEDIGLADPNAIILMNNLAQSNERVNRNGFVETFHPTMAVLYLCRSPKSREVDYSNEWVYIKRDLGWRGEVSVEALDEHNLRGRELLKKQAIEEDKNYRRLCDEVFYYQSALLDNPVAIANDKYKKLVWELKKLDKKKLHNKYEPK